MGHYAAQHTSEDDFWIIPRLSSSNTALQEHYLRGSYTPTLGIEICGLSGSPQDHSVLQAARRHLHPSTGTPRKVFA